MLLMEPLLSCPGCVFRVIVMLEEPATVHTGGLNLTNDVTSEGNWLHQILFRAFIAKEVNIYARTTFPFTFF